MNLSDKESAELDELCSALVDQRLTEAQRQRLGDWLGRSEDARRHYVSVLGQSASLHSYASEIHAEVSPARAPARSRWWWLGGGLAAAAAALAVMFTLENRQPEIVSSAEEIRPPALVARVSATRDVRWTGRAFVPGEKLAKGQDLSVLSGLVEVTFDSGARVVLEGPALLTVNSAWDSTLRRGTLSANVPPQALGFRIANESVDVVDLGTEFTMVADADGSTEVFVLKGEVEAAPRSASREAEVLLLREMESRRFASGGVSAVSDSESKFARLAQALPLTRFAPTYRYALWSFDEASDLAGKLLSDDSETESLPTLLVDRDVTAEPTVPGRWDAGLALDGRNYARTHFPGLSGPTTHTVAFWVRVPENASLTEAYSILGWRSSLAKLSYRPVHISWNRNPNEGPLGAIRTDFAGGCAMGTTSLRDGRWHHVAIVFDPGAGDAPVQVKQYVNGFLESSRIIPGRVRGPAGEQDTSMDDQLWIGSRIGATGPRQERFRGEVDELMIADGSLEPQDIVEIFQFNRFGANMGALAAQ